MPAIDLKKVGLFLGKGLIPEVAPDILKGTITELFRSKRVDVRKAREWVEGNISLWGSLEPKHQEQLRKLAQKLGDIGWIDSEWAISSLKDEFPALASLFLGWRKARNWLERQLDEIKKQARQNRY